MMDVWADRIREMTGGLQPEIGLVFGSGLAGVADGFRESKSLPWQSLPGHPLARVDGHRAEYRAGFLGGIPVIASCGRVHLYEGFSAVEATETIRLFASLGVSRLLLTNAAGSLRTDWQVGDFMLLTDHINLTGETPLSGQRLFLDQTRNYDPVMRQELMDAAARSGLSVREGIYAGLRGPEYETPAEVRMLQIMGADVVGMSTVLEVIQARALGLPVAAISCLTNTAAGLGDSPHHGEVLSCGSNAVPNLTKWLQGWAAEGG